MPVAVILSVAVAAFGALAALLVRSHANDIYAQISLADPRLGSRIEETRFDI